MSKLLKLKKWLTVGDAAKRLSISIGEEVTEADIFRLALDLHLSISVYFAEFVWVREVGFSTEYEGENKTVILSGINSDEPTRIDGVLDIAMTEAARLLVEKEYRALKGLPGITSIILPTSTEKSIILCDEDREHLFELLDIRLNIRFGTSRVHTNPVSDDSDKRLCVYAKGNNGHEAAKEALKIISGTLDDLGPVIEREIACFYRSCKLPESSVFVVRTKELMKFESSLISTNTNEKPLHSSERRSAGQIIATLAAMARLDLSTPYTADETLRAAAATHGLELPKSPETVKKFLEYATAHTGKD